MKAILFIALIVTATAANWEQFTRQSEVLAKQKHITLQEVKQELESLPKDQPTIQNVDLRTRGLRPVEDQGSCGSCVSFSTAHTIQDYFSAPGKACGYGLVATQHTLDCAISCNGGYIANAYNWFQNSGIGQQSCFRYWGTQLGCRSQCDAGGFVSRIKFPYICTNSVNTMKSWLDSGFPFTTGLQLQQSFFDFDSATVAQSSVYPRSTGDRTIIGGHAMEVVGYGTMGGVDYWLVKNSWGTGWGDNGFVKIRRGVNTGGIEGQACRPSVSGCPVMSQSPMGITADPNDGNTPNYQPQLLLLLGGNTAGDTNNALIREAALFATQVLLAAPTSIGGFNCIPALPTGVNSTDPTLTVQEVQNDPLSSAISLTMMTADQQMTNGVQIHVIFSFSISGNEPRCVGAGGTYDATVRVSSNGAMTATNIFATTAALPPGDGIDTGAVVGGSVAAAIVVGAAMVLGGLRWRRTRAKYKQLKSVHQEVMRRVTMLENGPAGDTVRKAALSTLLTKIPDDWTEYQSPVDEKKQAEITAEGTTPEAAIAAPVVQTASLPEVAPLNVEQPAENSPSAQV